MVHGKNRIPYWIDRRLTGLVGPEYHTIISFGLPIEPEDSQYGKYRMKGLSNDKVSEPDIPTTKHCDRGEIGMGKIKRISVAAASRLHWVMLATAGIAIITAVLTPSTDEYPAGFAGVSAPIVALCTATVALIHAVNGGVRIGRTKGIFLVLGSVTSAYLWMADAADAHLLSLEVPILLLMIFALASLFVLVATLILS